MICCLFCGSMARSTICCEIHSRRGVRFFTGGSASCEITHKTGGTICYGHRVLHLVRSHTKRFVAPSVCGSVGAWQEVRFVASSFCGCVGAWKEARFVASSFCGSVGAWQEVRFVFPVFRGSVGAWQEVQFLWLCRGMARSTSCCL